MELGSSYTYPGLQVSKCGKLFYRGQQLQLHTNHSLSTRGPIAYVTIDGRARQVSVASMVYEVWVLDGKYNRTMFLEFIDGNTNNCHADNLRRVTKKRNKPRDYLDESYDGSWLNGGDGIYI
jgi:hypothetical protein